MWHKSAFNFCMAIVIIFVFMASSQAVTLSPENIKAFGNNAELEFNVLTNFGDKGTFKAQMIISNHSNVSLPMGTSNWKIYIHSVKRILASESNELTITRIQGDLYEVAPTTKFKGLDVGNTLILDYKARGYITSYSDFMPRAFIADENGHSAIFSNTNTEHLPSFVRPFSQPEQFLRFNTPVKDSYGVVTATSRFHYNKELNKDIKVEKKSLIIPSPKNVKYSKGTATIDSTWSIKGAAGLKFEGQYLQQRLMDYGINIKSQIKTSKNAKQNVIEFIVHHNNENLEAYELNITSDKVAIHGNSPIGIFYGIQSFLSLFSAHKNSEHIIPALRIFDEPRFEWRGMHYDIARNFHGKKVILELIEQMGRYKLNKLHLHLTDDEGWRLEIPDLPELTTIGAFRCFDLKEETCLLPQLGNGPYKTAFGNGYLSRQDYVEILRFAGQRNITVVPEIDMPGHARAAIKAMQARYKKLKKAGQTEAAQQYLLSDKQDQSSYLTVQSYSDNSINVCLNSTYNFIEKVIYELQQMYRSADQKLEVFHMGGDEVGVGSWQASPACDKLFAATDNQVVGTADLKPYFVRRLSNITQARGLNLAGWEDGLMYDPNNVFIRDQLKNKRVFANAWDNIWELGMSDRAYRLANNGYDVILSSATHLYFDHPHEANASERGYHWATRYTDLKKVHDFMPENLYANADKTFTGAKITNLNALVGQIHTSLEKPQNIAGMQGHVWSETIRTPLQFEKMVFPRLLALAERAWFKAPWEDKAEDGEERTLSWQKFINTLVTKELLKLSSEGIEFHLPPPGAIRKNGELIANTLYPNLIIEYSLDDGHQWLQYKGKVKVADQPILLRSKLNDVYSNNTYLN